MKSFTTFTGSNEIFRSIFSATVTHWLVVSHENGRLVIYSLPDMAVVFQVGRFSNLPEVLIDLTSEEEEKERKAKAHQAAKEAASTDEVQTTVESRKLCERVLEAQIIGLCLTSFHRFRIIYIGMGINQAHPVLLAIVDEQVVFYEIFTTKNVIPGKFVSVLFLAYSF